MNNVSILGSGELGATVAQKLACADWPGTIRLIDTDGDVAKGRALDLLEANPVIGSGTAILGSERMGDIENSDVVVIADIGGADAGTFSVSETGKIVSVLEETARDAVVLVAIDEPAPLFRLISRSSRIDPGRVVGTAPEATASLWRHHIGKKVKCSPGKVQVGILGAPHRNGVYEVFASLAGYPIDRLLSPLELREIAAVISRRPQPGPRTLAAAAVAVWRDMDADAGTVRSCYAWANGAYGARNLFLCAPAVLGPRGAQKILELPLEPRQAVTLSRSLDLLAL